MKPTVGLLVAVVLAATGCDGGAQTAQEPAPGAGDHEISFVKSNGAKQELLLHAPEGFSTSKRYPLIVVFHGSPGTPSEIQHLAALDDLADSEGFITVYPDQGRDPETVGQLLDFLTSKWSVDPKRMHLAGFSAGASAVYGLAQTPSLTSRLGSVAPVSGAGASDTANTTAISLITFQGGRDNVGQAFALGNANWAKAAQCEAETVTELRLHDSPATRHTAECKDGAEFVYYDIELMGHTWPPDASPLIWEFFKKHPLA